jgi:membrane-bound metal-dependent hydrolase YbcI (DUF457 family)
MLTLTEIFSILIIHYIADFIVQTDKQAKGKSKNLEDLLNHTLTYSLCWFIVGYIIAYFQNTMYERGMYIAYSVIFFFITFVCHTITDYFTSRLNNRLAPKEETIMLKYEQMYPEPFVRFPEGRSYHNLFIGIGGDQVLHYIQLFLTYYFLK